jgi:16S rRNA (adenine1518-N6/adenine1519-N6)-dimethyltransferase
MGFVRAKKYLGQHFLTDKNIARKIVESLDSELPGNLLEIGPGTGILTDLLIQKTGIVFFAVEIDDESVIYLNEKYPFLGNRLIHSDFLKLDIPSLFPVGVGIIGNFPYNISTQIFFKVFENRSNIPVVVGMVQKEVAVRICSGPGSKNYGILSVLLQAFYDIKFLFSVPPQVFSPPPKVISAVIKLTRNSTDRIDCNESLFLKVVKAAFNQRRKIMRNSLNLFGVVIPDEFALLRPEQLTVNQFIVLTKAIEEARS